MRQQGINGLRGVHAGSCHAWPLPADATCATVARQVFREAVSEVGLEPDLLDDCILMASELAANTLHARAVARTGGGGIGSCPSPRTWEAEPTGSAGPAPRPRAPARPGPRSGLVALVGRRACRHGPAPGQPPPSRAGRRLGLRGKAVWFAVPAPLAHARLVDVTGLHAYTLSADVTATSRASERLSARQAARELEAMLDERGFEAGW